MSAFERGSFVVLRADGTEEMIREPPTRLRVRQAIGAERLDYVPLTWCDGRPVIVMAVDDDGYDATAIERGMITELIPTRAKKPINHRATESTALRPVTIRISKSSATWRSSTIATERTQKKPGTLSGPGGQVSDHQSQRSK
jgi:hypothetical protein